MEYQHRWKLEESQESLMSENCCGFIVRTGSGWQIEALTDSYCFWMGTAIKRRWPAVLHTDLDLASFNSPSSYCTFAPVNMLLQVPIAMTQTVDNGGSSSYT